ncbi:hypothetical protein [Paenibacillus sp. LHD-38]|uniref:hypothetical protein n=1 Tax=Paenibacillus sp. LHD-38 TaxID=3072143 RepID=UPI00280CFDAC|nr:hypothetical protein [Paenibacillus sp. LHD-38]MDQ8734822.1 hypothetical protein [Paenibacillus sp. LHD-38]
MGADLTAIFSHDLVLSKIDDIVKELNLLNIQELYEETSQEIWKISPDRSWGEGDIHIYGPHSLKLLFGEKCCQLEFPMRWMSFVDNENEVEVEEVRMVCRRISQLLKADFAIYIPDTAYTSSGVYGKVYEAVAIDTIVSWLLVNCGRPASKISDIFDVALGEIDQNGYFIDYFSLSL